jgi:hypothetical protein
LKPWKQGRSSTLLATERESDVAIESLESDRIILRRGVKVAMSKMTEHGLGEGDAHESPLMENPAEPGRFADLSSGADDSSSDEMPSAPVAKRRLWSGVLHPTALAALDLRLSMKIISFSSFASGVSEGYDDCRGLTDSEHPRRLFNLAVSSFGQATEVELIETPGALR